MNIKQVISTAFFVAGIMGRAEASNLVTLTCQREADNDAVAFLLNIDTKSVVSATDKSFGHNRLMFQDIPISASESELRWVWNDDKTTTRNYGKDIIKARRTYTIDRNTLEMTLAVDMELKHYFFRYHCLLSRRLL
jgi:hypothetical protein